MPLYEYQCEACGNRFEKIVKFSDPPLESCPKCGGAVQKLLSSPAIQFKGSGWYVTDYAARATKAEKSESEPAKEKKDSDTTKESSPGKKTSEKTSSPKTSAGD